MVISLFSFTLVSESTMYYILFIIDYKCVVALVLLLLCRATAVHSSVEKEVIDGLTFITCHKLQWVLPNFQCYYSI